MARFEFTGPTPVFYPSVAVDGALAPISPEPGDVYVLDEAPDDGRWAETQAEPTRVPDNHPTPEVVRPPTASSSGGNEASAPAFDTPAAPADPATLTTTTPQEQ